LLSIAPAAGVLLAAFLLIHPGNSQSSLERSRRKQAFLGRWRRGRQPEEKEGRMERRDFLKLSMGGAATLFVGTRLPWLGGGGLALAAGQTLTVTISDALKDMVTHQDPALYAQLGLDPGKANIAQCYFWIYKMSVNGGHALPAECPGPTIVATRGDEITVSVTNALEQPHAFFIPGFVDTGVIEPGETVSKTFVVNQSGAFLYYDNLNAPVNRMMGLHGALVVRPSAPSGTNFTPYDVATPGVQKLYDDFGNSEHFPGLRWEDGDNTPWALDPSVPNCPPFRTYVWLTHQASPNLFREVGSLPAGQSYDAREFMEKFLRSPFRPNQDDNYNPQYFTINGQSGFFGHFSPTITPTGRIGEPVVVHILNAGLWTHAMHLHGNHFYVTSINGAVAENPLWCDTYNVEPMDRIDYTVPFTRPPDVPNLRGIGLPDRGRATLRGSPAWPPVQEFNVYLPEEGDDIAENIHGQKIDLKQRLSPMCYPMHDHSEPTQTAQGGNYNCGLISGMYITGDRTTPGYMDFPMDEDFFMMSRNIRGISATGPAPGVEPPMEGHTHTVLG
jgi:hypothetical protein